ncbi:adenine deaminase [Niabella insulamsoli]|uniref:adenine deaminase n=1 Tax=Niabella insulamsoli TaxID=3144874 RepID=UPI0031FBF089
MQDHVKSFSITGQYVDIQRRLVFPAEINVDRQKITAIRELDEVPPDSPFILPGFIDSHVHIESSMLVPSAFARLAVVHGTVATVSDPHEIANVCGKEGIEYMIADGRKVPFKFAFGAPSCVPATAFETAGAALNANEVRSLLENPEIKYLSEMMNFPGVLNNDPEILAKIKAAVDLGKPVDGHAPGLRGEDVKQYAAAGISTDHECFTAAEALDKLRCGMKILIREGSAAKNFDQLIDLLSDYPDEMMFCSDDKHPDSLVAGHINQLCARAVARGIDVFNVLKAACVNPVIHYQLEVGLLQEGDPADFILVADLKNFEVLSTYINGEQVAANGQTLISAQKPEIINHFSCSEKKPADFATQLPDDKKIPVIEAFDGQLITGTAWLEPKIEEGYALSDTEKDILKIVVVNRYQDAPAAIAFIKNFGLREGAIASSVAHDSHNIVAVGIDDDSICKAVNAVIRHRGGISAVSGASEDVLPLPIGGLMSDEDGYQVAGKYTAIDKKVKEMGSPLSAPFMTLSFMALLVIPELKLSDKGLFDGKNFRFL